MSIQTRMANDQELAAAHAERDRLELAAVKKRIELTKENGIKVKTALEKQTNERLSQLSVENAENQVAHAKVIQMYKQREAKQQLLRSRQQTRRARIGANQAAQRSNKGDDERNKYLKLMAAGVGALAITFGIGEMFKNSKVANTLLGTIAKMLGMMVDLFIKPFLPILIPLLRGLGKFIQGLSKFLDDPTGWIKEKTGIGLPEQLNAPLAAAAGGLGLGALTLALSSRARGVAGRGIGAAARGVGGLFGFGRGGGGGTPPVVRPPIRPPRVPPTAGAGRALRGAGRLGIITAGLSGLSDLLSKIDWGKHLTGVGNFFNNLFGREAISRYLSDIKAFFKIFVWEERLQKVAKFFSNIFKFDEHLTKVQNFFKNIFKFNEHLDSVRRFFSKVFPWSEHLTKIQDFFANIFKFDEHLTKVGEFFTKIFKFDDHLASVKKFFNKIFPWSEHVTKVQDFFNKIFKFDEHVTKVGNFFTQIFKQQAHLDKIETFFSNVFKFDEHLRKVNLFFDMVFGPITQSNALRWVKDGIKNMFSFKPQFSEILTHIFGKAKGGFGLSDLMNFLKGGTPATGGRNLYGLGAGTGDVLAEGGTAVNKINKAAGNALNIVGRGARATRDEGLKVFNNV